MKCSVLIGDPVEHSISPKLFRIIMEKRNYEYAHLKMKISKVRMLEDTINKLFDLGFCGINVTCPYKMIMYNLVDEFLDGAENIYSINTIFKKNNKIYGCNTDGKAAIISIEKFRKIKKEDKIVLYGAGGAAYSIFYEISKLSNNITVINESLEEANLMIKRINNNAVSYDLIDKDGYLDKLIEADIIINATSVGMYPNSNESVIDLLQLKSIPSNKLFFDVVFNPWETKFLKQAKKYNHVIISGGDMLINQALLAIEKWVDIKIKLTDEEFNDISKLMIEEIEKNYD